GGCPAGSSAPGWGGRSRSGGTGRRTASPAWRGAGSVGTDASPRPPPARSPRCRAGPRSRAPPDLVIEVGEQVVPGLQGGEIGLVHPPLLELLREAIEAQQMLAGAPSGVPHGCLV